jgi:RNA polymerase sigma-70 factor (ECF subfamily)
MTELLSEDVAAPTAVPRSGVAAPAPPTPAAGARPTGERREALEGRLERHRPALTAHCRRLLGSSFEADDAVQETMVRAWRSYDRFEGRASLTSWLHRIATNVCFDMRSAPQRRARPTDPATWATAAPAGGTRTGTGTRGGPAVDTGLPAVGAGPAAESADPAEQAVGREDVRLAFVAALLHLPPRQRSVLLLCEVLRWRASEVAELLGTSVASVNSALQRARATLSDLRSAEAAADPSPQALDDDQRALLHRYTAAFDRYDIASLVALLR